MTDLIDLLPLILIVALSIYGSRKKKSMPQSPTEEEVFDPFESEGRDADLEKPQQEQPKYRPSRRNMTKGLPRSQRRADVRKVDVKPFLSEVGSEIMQSKSLNNNDFKVKDNRSVENKKNKIAQNGPDNELLKDVDWQKAVIFSEIFKPKFDD